jgi:hypothetical protein
MPTSRKLSIPGLLRALLGLAWSALLAFAAQGAELSNDTLTLRLQVTSEGIPIIKEALWRATGQTVFRDLGTPDGLKAWVPAALLPSSQTQPGDWRIQQGEPLTTAEASRELANKMRITWIVELPKTGQLFRLRIRLTNGGYRAQSVEWFPAWSAGWTTSEPSQWARWWQALEYDRKGQVLIPRQALLLHSQGHSSDDVEGGVNPYWIVGGQSNRLYFGLQWSGGWSAKLEGLNKGFRFSVFLPPQETQLVLRPGEAMEGPALLVMPMTKGDDPEERALWMKDRQNLGQKLYAAPPPAFPLSYNTWYASRKILDTDFVKRQLAAMPPYAFDSFVIDAGWFGDGRWEADKTRFPGGELAAILASLKANGIQPGLWTTPQYVTSITNSAALSREHPTVFNGFLGGYLVDMSSSKFADYLIDHVRRLRQQFSIAYWKYDQPFFTRQTSAGKMKNVTGFQQALEAVRRANPDLVIENCLNGGRMLNEFTLLATQTSWLRDMGHRKQPTPQMNIRASLNALEFVFPWAALRFTVNVDKLDQNDDEMTRLHCRSAMAGRWGISTDLALVSERQQTIILQEIANYRRLNPLKYACLYELQLPADHAEMAGVTFYSANRQQAGILLYRWQRQGTFHQPVKLARLNSELIYRVQDVDTQTETTVSGATLIGKGLQVAFSSQRQSALLFVEPVR